jgi:hypothetical protein
MDLKELIILTIKNMESIYGDISKIIEIIEEKLTNSSFIPIGGNAVTWDNRSVFDSPKDEG